MYMYKLEGHVRYCPTAGDMARGYVYAKIEYVHIFQKMEYISSANLNSPKRNEWKHALKVLQSG